MPSTSVIFFSTSASISFLAAPRYPLGSNAEGSSAKLFLMAAVIARRISVSIFILHTAIDDAFLSISTGIPFAPSIFPPYSLHVATEAGSADEAP